MIVKETNMNKNNDINNILYNNKQTITYLYTINNLFT